MVKTGIIGGSGLEDPDILDSPEIIKVSNKYGSPASPLICGKISNTETVILSRHGKDHTPIAYPFDRHLRSLLEII